MNSETCPISAEIKDLGFAMIDRIKQETRTLTKPGSISYLLYGEKPSEQSILIKIGHFGEFIFKKLITLNADFELLQCGVQTVGSKKKDIDLIFRNSSEKIIYFRELKGNIELDTEKVSATIAKCKEIEEHLRQTYPDYRIDFGILNWSIYNRKILKAGLSNIQVLAKAGVRVDHIEDFLGIIRVQWDEADYYSYFREIGARLQLVPVPDEPVPDVPVPDVPVPDVPVPDVPVPDVPVPDEDVPDEPVPVPVPDAPEPVPVPDVPVPDEPVPDVPEPVSEHVSPPLNQ